MPNAAAGTLGSAKRDCPKKRIVINLDSTHAAHRPAFSAMTVRLRVPPIIMSGDVSSPVGAINSSADYASAYPFNSIIFHEPKFVGAVIRKIGPRTVAASITIRFTVMNKCEWLMPSPCSNRL